MVLAHILERHYYKLPRHPLAGKFTISIPELVNAIKEAGQLPPESITGRTNLQRVWETGTRWVMILPVILLLYSP